MEVFPNQRATDHRPGPLLLLQVLSLILAGMLVITVPLLILSVGVEKALLCGISLCAMLILLVLVFIRKEYDIFEPISFVMLFTLLGVTLRIAYLLLYYRSNNDSIAFLLRGKPPEFLLTSGILIIVALFSFVLGYAVNPWRLSIQQFSLIRRQEWSGRRFFVTLLGLELIAAIATYFFIKELGVQFLALSDISSKHFEVVEGAGARTSFGYFRWPASFAEIAFYLGITWFAASGKRWFSLAGGGVLLLGVLASVFPFLNSSRSSVAFIIISGMVICHYLRKEISIRKMAYAVLTVVAILLMMTALRKNVNEVNALIDYLTMEKILDQLVGSGKFLDITKPAHIMAAIPTKVDYQFGMTFMLWLFAPIPRTLWVGKPVINISTTVGQMIYETMDVSGLGAGIPPGFVAELYWNFHFPGILAGLFVMGLWLKFLYVNFKEHLSSNKNAVLFYILLMMPCVNLLQGSFVSFIIDVLKALVPLMIVLRFVGKSPGSYGFQ